MCSSARGLRRVLIHRECNGVNAAEFVLHPRRTERHFGSRVPGSLTRRSLRTVWRDDPEPEAVSGRLILLCGLAGAGKTTLAKQLEADGAVRMCPDEWLVALGFDIYDKDARVAVERLQWEWTQALVLRGLTVVDECGVWQRWERDLRRMWAREHGIPIELRFLDAPVEVLAARVEERNRTLPGGAPRIDPALVAFWDRRIERPDAHELALFD